MLAAKSSKSRFSHLTSKEGNSNPTPGPNSLPILTEYYSSDLTAFTLFEGETLSQQEPWKTVSGAAMKIHTGLELLRRSRFAEVRFVHPSSNVWLARKQFGAHASLKLKQGWTRSRLYNHSATSYDLQAVPCGIFTLYDQK